MTKQKQIEILSKLYDTASMVDDDREELYSVIKEMKDEPETQFITAYNVDKLIETNGDWKLCYEYSNYGNNTLMLLPDDTLYNAAEIILDMNRSEFEESLVIDIYIKSCPNNPFIIRENGFIKSVEELTSRLSQLIDEDNTEKFNEEFDKFLDFVKVCELIQQDEGGFVYEVLHKGWEHFVPEKKVRKDFDKDYKLLEKMYKDSFYPPHLIDIFKASLTSIINILETGERDMNIIKRSFESFVMTVTVMSHEFTYLRINDISKDIIRNEIKDTISNDVKYILSWFNIDMDVEYALTGLL